MEGKKSGKKETLAKTKERALVEKAVQKVVLKEETSRLTRAGFKKEESHFPNVTKFVRDLEHGRLMIARLTFPSTGFSCWLIRLSNDEKHIIPIMDTVAPTLEIAWIRFKNDSWSYMDKLIPDAQTALNEALEVDL